MCTVAQIILSIFCGYYFLCVPSTYTYVGLIHVSCANKVYALLDAERMFAGDKFRMVIATSLHEDGMLDDGEYDPTDSTPSRADSFEYVTYGKVYRIEGDESTPEPGSRL